MCCDDFANVTMSIGAPWSEWIIPGFGKVVYDEGERQLGAHCGCREHRPCRINKVLAKRPLGYLVGWLRIGHLYPNHALHDAAKTQQNPGQVLDLAARLAARRFLEEDPLYANLLALEPPPELGLPVEPLRVT
jgi:hypothetical protein